MGYEHYWYRPPEIPDEVFHSIGSDLKKLVIPMAEMGVRIADGNEDNEPEISDDKIWFNGLRKCGHAKNPEIFIPYPAEDARGLGASLTAIVGYDLVVRLKHRCCSGRCSHEPFIFPKTLGGRNYSVSDQEETRGLCGTWTKTEFKSYDIAVTAVLLIAKRYLRDRFIIHSDGLDAQWADAKDLCQRHLGYGDWFGIVEDPRVELVPGPNGKEVEHEARARILIEMDPSGFNL
jgi:hypothetical protein